MQGPRRRANGNRVRRPAAPALPRSQPERQLPVPCVPPGLSLVFPVTRFHGCDARRRRQEIGREEALMATVGSMASVAFKPQYVPAAKRGLITRLLEDERRLAICLMLPTLVLLALFIAYPFVNGILLAVTDTRVGVPGQFVGADNFVKIWTDDIFHVAVCNTCLYTFVTTVFKLALGLWLA